MNIGERIKPSVNDLVAIKASKTCWIAYFATLLIQVVFCIQTQSIPLIITTILFAIIAYFGIRKSMQMFSLSILIFTIVYLVIGVMVFEWGFEQIAALFFTMAIITGMALGKGQVILQNSLLPVQKICFRQLWL